MFGVHGHSYTGCPKVRSARQMTQSRTHSAITPTDHSPSSVRRQCTRAAVILSSRHGLPHCQIELPDLVLGLPLGVCQKFEPRIFSRSHPTGVGFPVVSWASVVKSSAGIRCKGRYVLTEETEAIEATEAADRTC